MRIIECEDYAAMSRRAALSVAETVRAKPGCLLGLATGSTPLGTYEELVQLYRSGALDLSGVRSVNLDEYVGMAPDHPQSYRRFMDEHLFSKIDIRPDDIHFPNGLATDLAAEAARYEALLTELGGADLQILGIGQNGHIGFNEPGGVFRLSAHVVDLDESTLSANARFFSSRDQVPRQALTMGIGDIMRARKILLLVSGEGKAEILRQVLTADVDPRIPASVLHLHHHVTVLADRAALRLV